MANDIYSTTHSGLSTLVSPRVASRVLETALRKRKLSAEKVTAKEMKSLLRGPILKDLTGILPKSGLEHSLHKLSKSVATLSSVPGLVEAHASPKPWSDTPPGEPATYTPAFELEEGDLYPEAEVGRGVLNENVSPQKNQPKVEITKTGETYLNGDPLQSEQLHGEQLHGEQQDSQASSDEAAEPPLGSEDESITESALSESAVPESAVPETEIFQTEDVVEKTIDTETRSLENISASETDLAAENEVDEASEPDTLRDHDFEGKSEETTDFDTAPEDITTHQQPADIAEAESFDHLADEASVSSESSDLGSTKLEDDLETEYNGNLAAISENDLEDFILQFAQLDNVRMVAALAPNGQVVRSRGDGYDLDTLSRLGTLGLKLLSRSGKLRSYYLAFKGGQLFFFPLGGYTLCIIGTTELNLGLVFATLHKLKEDV